jgi:hypothetical protein
MQPTQNQAYLSEPSFGSRIRAQSRPVEDARGNIIYEHNSPLQVGEFVMPPGGGAAVEILAAGYRNPLTGQQLVTVLWRYDNGNEEQVKLAASAVRRI